MNFTNQHHPEPKPDNRKFKPNCCCHDYPGHFSSVDCSNKQLKTCSSIKHNNKKEYNKDIYHHHNKKPCNCK